MRPTPARTQKKRKKTTQNSRIRSCQVAGVGSSIRRKAERRGRLYYNCPIIRGRRTAADKSINHQLDRRLKLSSLFLFLRCPAPPFDLLHSSRLTILGQRVIIASIHYVPKWTGGETKSGSSFSWGEQTGERTGPQAINERSRGIYWTLNASI